MENYELLKSQKNEVFEILQKAGLEPANFSWKWGEMADLGEFIDVPRLEYLDGQYYFEFKPDFSTFTPGRGEAISTERAGSWGMQRHHIREWVICLKREIEAPDLWAEMEKYKLSFSVTLPQRQVNEPISASEAEKISDKLSLLTNTIEQQFDLDAEHKKFVRSKLNYLAEAAKRQSGLDWVHTLIGVSVTIVLSLNLTPDKASELWQLIKSVLGPFIHLIGP